MRRIGILAVVLVASACVGRLVVAWEDAQAHGGSTRIDTHHWSPTQAAYTVAAQYWHQQPCSGHIKIVTEAPWANDEINVGGAATSMWASWDLGTPYENNETAPLPFRSCIIGINSEVWTSTRQEGETMWPDFAITMVHEFGHLLGYSHSTDPMSVMFPTPSDKTTLTGEYAPGWGYIGQ